jgi:hypothetical protein
MWNGAADKWAGRRLDRGEAAACVTASTTNTDGLVRRPRPPSARRYPSRRSTDKPPRGPVLSAIAVWNFGYPSRRGRPPTLEGRGVGTHPRGSIAATWLASSTERAVREANHRGSAGESDGRSNPGEGKNKGGGDGDRRTPRRSSSSPPARPRCAPSRPDRCPRARPWRRCGSRPPGSRTRSPARSVTRPSRLPASFPATPLPNRDPSEHP